jgi:hypothetical protein
MKTYTETSYHCGKNIDVLVNIPTPKELQATTKNEEFSVVVSNFCVNGRTPEYAVALFEKETSEILINMGFLFKNQAKDANIRSFKGVHARRDAIETARDMLLGRY